MKISMGEMTSLEKASRSALTDKQEKVKLDETPVDGAVT